MKRFTRLKTALVRYASARPASPRGWRWIMITDWVLFGAYFALLATTSSVTFEIVLISLWVLWCISTTLLRIKSSER